MPPTPFHQLSDEPLYCEAVHNKDDDDFYSGSEDDHYEGPLHRRLHIEKRAVDFLSGNVPILLCAALRGPFDKKQWNNPWRSTRAASHAEPAKAQPSRSRSTVAPEEDLPDTQGTSLYPLPSPEITNPPSARKNPYMDEQGYSRVKTWTEAVKSTSVSKDSFWQSQQDEDDSNPPARKRSADSTWLHKRDRKKRRSVNPRNSTPDDSPSRVAARAKGSQARHPPHVSQIAAQPLRDSSPREDELATSGRTRSSYSNTTPVANKSSGVPNLLWSGRTTPRRRTQLRQAADSSEDELSMPAATPTSNGVRSSTMISASPTRHRSPSRRSKTTKGKSRPTRGRRNSLIGREKVEKSQLSCPSTSQRSGRDRAIAGSRTVAQVGEGALECMDESPDKLSAKQSEPLQRQLLTDSAAIARPMVFSLASATLPSTQQDNSFFFHKRARSPADRLEIGRSAGVPTNGAALSPSSLQLYTTERDGQRGHLALDDGPAAPGPTTLTRKDSHNRRNLPSEIVEESRDLIDSPDTDEGFQPTHNTASTQRQWAGGNQTNGEIKATNGSPAKVEHDAANDSAQVVRTRCKNKPEVLEEFLALPQKDSCAQSDSEWSTHPDTQDRTPACSPGETTKKSNDIPVVEYGVDGLSDPEWSTFVNTQDITPFIPRSEASVDPEEATANIACRSPDGVVESDQTTHTNIQSLPPVSSEGFVMVHESALATVISISSPVLAGQAGDPCEDSTPARASPDARLPEAGVGSIIDAYADISILSMDSEMGTTGMPEDELGGTAAEGLTSPCSLPDQITTAPVDESDVPNENISIEKLQPLQEPMEKRVATEPRPNLTCDPSRPDEIVIGVETRNFEDSSDTNLQTPRVSESAAGCSDGSSFLDETTASIEIPQLQSPWINEAAGSLKMPPRGPNNDTRTSFDSGGLNETATGIQSPWNKKADTPSHLFGPPMSCTSPTESRLNLSLLAGKALAMSQPPQVPWGPQTPAARKPPAAEFEMSIRAFSDFMSPSPVRMRASLNGSILRCSSGRSGILFKTTGQRNPGRRVHFGSLPGQQETCVTKPDAREMDYIFGEEDVSYFDPSGQKTGTMRLPKPTTRAASPPPMEMSSVEVSALPDHDKKFAKHFEAMSKRTKPRRKSLRLLPSDPQQTTSASQDVGAMAEAFIQASQTRKKGLELAAEKASEAELRHDNAAKATIPVAMDVFEDQENVEPVDDVSAVLDNLDKFLDNTWDIEVGTEDRHANDMRNKHEKEASLTHDVQPKVADPMLLLEANVWAD